MSLKAKIRMPNYGHVHQLWPIIWALAKYQYVYMKSASVIDWYHLIISHFLHFILIFANCLIYDQIQNLAAKCCINTIFEVATKIYTKMGTEIWPNILFIGFKQYN